jgi:TRAP-type C4-dicarboxylate transport system permease small subunit
MAAIVFLGLAYTGWVGGHIAVDLFEKWLDRPGLRILTAAIAFVGAGLFFVVAYRAALETIATIGQVSNRLGWPHYPFRFTVVIGSALLAIVLVVQGVQALRSRRAGDAK